MRDFTQRSEVRIFSSARHKPFFLRCRIREAEELSNRPLFFSVECIVCLINLIGLDTRFMTYEFRWKPDHPIQYHLAKVIALLLAHDVKQIEQIILRWKKRWYI